MTVEKNKMNTNNEPRRLNFKSLHKNNVRAYALPKELKIDENS